MLVLFAVMLYNSIHTATGGIKMIFNLNEFLLALSFALDFVEMDILGITSNHSKRVAYISMRIAERLGMSPEEIFDIVSLAILHDNGACEKVLHDNLLGNAKGALDRIENMQEHCIIGEENIRNYPFLTGVNDVLKYHHEKYDGTGYFGLRGDETPIISQIIALADSIERRALAEKGLLGDKDRILAYVRENAGTVFAPRIVDAFIECSRTVSFWMDLQDEFISIAMQRSAPHFSREMPLSKILDITGVFSRIIDSKSRFTREHSRGLSQKSAVMADYYRKPKEEKIRLTIAADLHDIGKLAVSNSILDKPGKLEPKEFEIMKRHTYYTRLSLQGIKGFEDITEWAANHHEKLDGNGYPFGKSAKELDFNSRLLACLDIYQALSEERPYRTSMPHEEVISIMYRMSGSGAIDESIVNDINWVFGR